MKQNVYTKQQLMDMGFGFDLNGNIETPDEAYERAVKYYEYRKKRLIDKACEWLKNTIDDDVFVNCGSVIKCIPANEFVEYFRKAMEE